MQTISLNTGGEIPTIGFGTWKIRLNNKAETAVFEALAAGYRLIDTARIYGNEKGVGKAIRESGVPRADIFVTTKLWNSDQGYEKGLKAFDDSLKRLDLEYVDLYLIHWPVPVQRLESWRALEEIYKSGRAKAIGVSNFTVPHLEELLSHLSIVPSVNQVEFHPYIYEDQKPLLEFCKQQGMIMEAYSPLAHGHNLGNRHISQLADKYGKSNAQIILRWCLQHATVPLPKSSNAERIRENLDIFNFELTAAEMVQINSLSDGTRTCWDPTEIQ